MSSHKLLSAALSLTVLLGLVFAVEPGDKAADFTLPDISGGSERSLTDYAGKIVVLEWLNPHCPFVHKHYDGGHMQALQKKYRDQGVVWLCIQSGPQGKTVGTEVLAEFAKKTGAAAEAILRDEGGKAGKLYGATNTPYMVVIGKDGKIAYLGGIDDKPDTDAKSLETKNNYVVLAVEALLAGKDVETRKAPPYGCGVEY